MYADFHSFMAGSLDDAAIDAVLDHLSADRLPSRARWAVNQIRMKPDDVETG